MSRDKDQKGKESPYIEMAPTMTKTDAHLSEKLQFQNHSLTFINRN